MTRLPASLRGRPLRERANGAPGNWSPEGPSKASPMSAEHRDNLRSSIACAGFVRFIPLLCGFSTRRPTPHHQYAGAARDDKRREEGHNIAPLRRPRVTYRLDAVGRFQPPPQRNEEKRENDAQRNGGHQNHHDKNEVTKPWSLPHRSSADESPAGHGDGQSEAQDGEKQAHEVARRSWSSTSPR